ncbi:hypothetical protein [Rhodocaloribacter sp.]
MTKLSLTEMIQSCLLEIDALVRKLGTHDLDDSEQCHEAIEEITQLYASVALCRSMLGQLESLHKEAENNLRRKGPSAFAMPV